MQHAPRAATVQLLLGALPLSELERQLLEHTAAAPAAGQAEASASQLGDPQPGAPPPRLVGRARERAVLERHVRGEGPPVLVLSGEPGIGKSRLLQEGAAVADAAGLYVVRTAAAPGGWAGAHDPVVDALRADIQRRSPVELRRDLQGCAWLVHLLPELAAGPIEPLPSMADARQPRDALGARAAARYLSNVAGPHGALLVLDNLHHANTAALDLLARLIESAPDVPLRIVAAQRDSGAPQGHALASLLAGLVHEQLLQHIRVGPLSRQESAELLAQLLDGGPAASAHWRERVLDLAEGVPFYLVAWAQELRARAAELASDELPWAIRHSVRCRIDAVSPDLGALMDAVVVAEDGSSYAVLALLTGRPEQHVFETLEAACRAGLLNEEAQTYRFAHPTIRAVVERELSDARRVLLSRRLGALSAQAPDAATDSTAYPAGDAGGASERQEREYHLAVLRRHQQVGRGAGPGR